MSATTQGVTTNAPDAIEAGRAHIAALEQGVPVCYRGTIGCTYKGDRAHECGEVAR